MAIEAGDIVAGLTALGIEHGAFIGTSRGGLIIHVLAATRPAALKAVILNDIGPVVEGEGLAHIRAYLERAPKPHTFADAVAIQRAAHGAAFCCARGLRTGRAWSMRSIARTTAPWYPTSTPSC